MVVVSAEVAPVVQQVIQQGHNTLQGLVGPMPQAAEELRRRYLGWRDEAERVSGPWPVSGPPTLRPRTRLGIATWSRM
jgi:hypothetical protein